MPGRYRLELQLPLGVAVCAPPRSLRFHKKDSTLRIELTVVAEPAASAADSAPQAPALPSAVAAQRAEAESLAAAAVAAVQEEKLDEAARLMNRAAALCPEEFMEAAELIEAARSSCADLREEEQQPAAPAATANPSEPMAPVSPPQSRASPPTPVQQSKPSPAAKKQAAGRSVHWDDAVRGASDSDAQPLDAPNMDVSWEGLVHVWDVALSSVLDQLPVLLDAAGWPGGEAALAAALTPNSHSRTAIYGLLAIAMALFGGLAIFLLFTGARVLLTLAFAAVSALWRGSWALLRAATWAPRLWGALPACLALKLQPVLPGFRGCWWAPFWWWMLRGGAWAVGATCCALLNLLFLGSVPCWMAVACLTLLRGASGLFATFWLRLLLAACVCVLWALGNLLYLVALAEAAGRVPGALCTDVPEGATGEVGRILGCATHYAVLEVDPMADEDAIRRAHRRKALLVHPDKCGTAHASAAFQRVQDAFQLLSDKGRRMDYDLLLSAETTCAEEETAYAPRHRSARRRKRV